MAADLAGVFDEGLRTQILKSKILVVGAGGIGCEILKNLVMSGFPDIEIIDLDTIDVSNLNRQFLFHKEHVGKSKAEVARESALSFNPKVNIKAYHDSITSTKYSLRFFGGFTVVLNALDNRAARNHVNRMCLTANVPLIESGTAGYNGQVELIEKGLTQCYECTPKAAQKSYPGCTIRNTPSEPIHCIVWAKHLFNQLFGESNDDEDVSPDTADPEAGGDAGTNALVSDTETGNVERVNTRQWANNTNYDPEKIFNKLFHDDIKYLLSMSNLWKTRTPPAPVKWGNFDGIHESEVANNSVLPDQRIWSLAECAEIFASSLAAIKEEFIKLSKGDHLVWDKDDKHAMDFVAACANIRAIIFNISKKSRFDIKSMAGNIIPAIATTNAITAGIVVMHAFKVLQRQLDKCQSVYLRLRPNARNQILVPDRKLNPPNPKCYVCSPKPEVVLKVDTEKTTVKELRDDILIKSLNMVDPDVTIEGKGVIVISSEEGETDSNNDKNLSELQIVDGTILLVDDFFQEYELTITIFHKSVGRDEPPFEIVADPDSLKPKAMAEDGNGNENAENKTSNEDRKMDVEASTSNGESSKNVKKPHLDVSSDEEDLCIIEEANDTTEKEKESTAVKRRANGGEGPSTAKRMRKDTEDEDDDLIILDE